MKIILGSQSPSRRRVLAAAGYTFDVMPADIDEKAIRADDYHELPLLIARGKAEALLQTITEPALLITSDQVTVFKGELREKPESPEQARAWLKEYQGDNPSVAHTAVVMVDTQTGERREGIDTVNTWFDPLPDAVITELIETGKVFGWAGAVGVDDPLFEPYVRRMDGPVDSILGLPLELVERFMAELA